MTCETDEPGEPSATDKKWRHSPVLPVIAWKGLEKASFGLIYGAIMVLSVLMALEFQPNAPFRPAFILFGSVLAMTCARALAVLLAHAIETGERVLTVTAIYAAWSGGQSMISVANVPTALFVAVGLGWLPATVAFLISQAFCVFLLMILGARVGWIVSRDRWHPVIGAVSVGSLGFALATLKYAIH